VCDFTNQSNQFNSPFKRNCCGDNFIHYAFVNFSTAIIVEVLTVLLTEFSQFTAPYRLAIIVYLIMNIADLVS